MRFDYLIVGAGPFGAAFARRVAEAGRRCIVIERRSHIAGNCFTELVDDVHVHRYGPHIFHTADEGVWHFVRQFAEFNNYRHRAQVIHGGTIYPFPINLKTLRLLWGVQTSKEAEAKLAEVRIWSENPQSLRDWLLSQVGEELYTIFFRDYTRKQWGRDPAQLPVSIARRIPIRTTENDSYFGDTIRYTGIPIGGYTQLFANMLDHPNIRVELRTDFFSRRCHFENVARDVVYAGKIDAYFDYFYGRLAFRSLRFVDERHTGWHQPVAMINYTDASTDFTRKVEHKHFQPTDSLVSIVTREYPEEHTPGNEPYYPIRDAQNVERLDRYLRLAKDTRTIIGGRLGSYHYLNMDQAIAQALTKAERHLGLPSVAGSVKWP